MAVELEDISLTKKKLTIDIPSDVIEGEIENVYKKLSVSAKIPGFRPGKVPRLVLEKRFGKSVETEVIEKLVPEFYTEAVREVGLAPVTYPVFDSKIEMKRNQPLSFTVTVEVRPKIEGLNYDGFALKEVPLSVDDKDIDDAIKGFQEQAAVYEVVDDSVRESDLSVISFEGFDEDRIVDGLKAEDYSFIHGDERLPEEFSSGIIGKNKGDSFDVYTSFPADFHNKAIAGKSIRFRITIKEIKRKRLPSIDDEFANGHGYSDIADMREKLKKDIEGYRSEVITAGYKRELLGRLVESIDFELPQTMLGKEIEYMMLDEKRNALKKGEAARTDDELRAGCEGAARRNLKAMFIIDAIAEKEGINVTEEDVRNRLKAMAHKYNVRPEELMKVIISREGSLDGLKREIFEDRVIDLVLSKASISPAH